MKQSNVPVIIVSVIAFIALLAVLSASVFLVAYHVKNPDATFPPPQTSTPAQTSQTPTPDATEPAGTPSGTPESTPPAPETDLPAPTASTPDVQTQTPVEKKPYVLAPTSDAGIGYQNRVTFLGDSTTYHMITYGVLSGGENTRQVWFGAKGTLSLLMATANDLYDDIGAPASAGKPLDAMAKEKKPEIFFITLGAGVSYDYSEARFTMLYNAVIDTVLENSPDTTIICNSIYPVCRTGSALGSINNPDIDRANVWIENCARAHYADGKRVYYLDSNTILKDAEGYLPDIYSNGDGLHLNEKGYEIILENLRKHRLPDR